MVDHHAGLAAFDALDLLDRGHIHRNILTRPGLGIVSRQLGRLGHGIVGGDFSAAGDHHMGPVNLGGVAPDIVLPGKLEGQLVVAPVVPAHVNGEAVGALKPQGQQLFLLHPAPGAQVPDIAAGGQLLADLLQLVPGRIIPVQSPKISGAVSSVTESLSTHLILRLQPTWKLA